MRKLKNALAKAADAAAEAAELTAGVERSRLTALANILRAESRAIERRAA